MRIRSTLALLALFLVSTSTYADEKADTGRLTIDRIYEAPEFGGEHFSGRWVEGFDGYLTWEPSSDPVGGNDLVRNDPATGAKEVIVSAARLVPEGGSGPLNVENYAFSQDRSKLLIFTNSKRVWRQNTRGDYWVLDRGSRELRKLGGSAPESSLMFAKLSPDGLRAAYVRDNAIFVEDLRDHGIIEVSSPTSEPGVIQGTFDWVYEEELNLRDGFRWSPDSKMIAYWRLETKEEPDFPLVNTTAGLYPNIKTFKYPKVGERNAAADVGVVFAAGGGTRWLDVPGDPRENYLAYLEWHKPSGGLVVQQLNRLQQIERVFFATGDTLKEGAGDPPVLANDEPAAMRYVLTEHDDAWVDHQEKIHWIDKGQAFLWLSERDGWRHVYRAPLDGKAETLITPGDYDVIKIEAVDHNEGLLYFQAAPDEPTRRSLFRVKLDGTGLERVTPQNQPGTHEYDISPDAKWAIHHFSAADTPPTVDLVRLPSHERVRECRPDSQVRGVAEAADRVFPRRHWRWRRARRLVRASPRPRSVEEVSTSCVRLWRAGGFNRRRRLGRRQPALAPDARARGVCCDELRQPRDERPARACLAEVDLSQDRHPRAGGPSESGPQGALATAVSRPEARGRLGMERRRFDEPQRHLQVSRPLFNRNRHRPGGQSALLRHDLSRTLHGLARRQRRGLHARIADHPREGLKGQPSLDTRHR